MNIRDIIIKWYHENKRDLPWRRTKDPYKIWLSEIILQQTRVEQGMSYYLRFVDKYPDINSLALASEQEILKMWQGLGYYSRARNMLETARKIKSESGAKFPVNYNEIIKYKGIGQYTASAIASIAFDKPTPVMDGNVKRVVSRIFGINDEINSGKAINQIDSILLELIDHENPGDFNQAMMEFGALHCKPQNPLCETCPLVESCQAYHSGMVDKLPVLLKKAKQKQRKFDYAIILSRKEKKVFFWIRKRTANDIWKNMYDFPLLGSTGSFIDDKDLELINTSSAYKHQLTHQLITARFYIYLHRSPLPVPRSPDHHLINLSHIDQYPFPRLIDKYIQGELIAEIKKIEY